MNYANLAFVAFFAVSTASSVACSSDGGGSGSSSSGGSSSGGSTSSSSTSSTSSSSSSSGSPSGTKSLGEDCTKSSECKEDKCVLFTDSNGMQRGFCSRICTKAADCPETGWECNLAPYTACVPSK